MSDPAEVREDVEEKLIYLLPYVLSSRFLKKQTFYRVNVIHGYTRDILAILVGLGLGFPGARILIASSHENLGDSLSHLPRWEWLTSLILLLAAVFIRVYVTREGVERRAHLVDECERELDLKFLEIQQALEQRNPLIKLTSVRNSVATLVLHHTRERSYTFRGGWAPGTDIEARLKAVSLCDDNERKWR